MSDSAKTKGGKAVNERGKQRSIQALVVVVIVVMAIEVTEVIKIATHTSIQRCSDSLSNSSSRRGSRTGCSIFMLFLKKEQVEN